MEKKKYFSPEFDEFKISISNQLLAVSTEEVIHDGNGEAEDW